MSIEPLSVPVHEGPTVTQNLQSTKQNFTRTGVRSNQDRRVLLELIKHCGKQNRLRQGSKIHNDTIRLGFDSDFVVGTALISMYSKCGALEEAEYTFSELSLRDAVSWTSIIAGYTQHGLYEKALICYQNMQDEGFYPDAVTYACVLKACGGTGSIQEGEEIHAKVRKHGLLGKHIILANALVSMYAKCGELSKAQDVFDKIHVRDVVSWNSLVAGYAQHGFVGEAMCCIHKMQDDGFNPEAATFACLVRACGNSGSIQNAQEIHNEVKKLGLLEKDIVLGTMLIDMYAKCGVPSKAQAVFSELPFRDFVAWSALIAGYAQKGLIHEAIDCVKKMQNEGFAPDAATFSCLLKACADLGLVEMGEEIHAELMKHGFLENNVVLGTALIDMYAKCGALDKAQNCFDKILVKDASTWNALIDGYTNYGEEEKALKCFEQMIDHGISPDAVNFACALKACGITGSIEKGEAIHTEVQKQGLVANNVILGTALVDMYAKCGFLEKAQNVFDELQVRDLVTWTALIGGYAQHGQGNKALDCFENMLSERFTPDAITFACVLRACGTIGSIEKGEEIHAEIRKHGLIEENRLIGIALIDMYAKCSVVAKAQDVFDEIPDKDVAIWNTLIAGYAQLGQIETAFTSFCKMIADDIVPNELTFLILLTACSHTGLADEGEMYFTTMNNIYYLDPTLEHLTCMVDLFSRAGYFSKALVLIKKVHQSDCFPLWSALLGSCVKWGNVEFGKLAFENLVQMNEVYAPSYICMSNIYANAGMQNEAKQIESLRMEIEQEKHQKT